MKKLKVLAGAVALALSAGQAHAALSQDAATTGSSLFLAVWNGSTSYIRDLGIHLSDMLTLTTPGNINTATGPSATWTSNAGFTFTNAGDSLFTSTFSSLAGLNWTVFAEDSGASPNIPGNPGGFVSGFSTGPTSMPFSNVSSALGRANSYMGNVNNPANTACATNTSCVAPLGNAAYAGNNTTTGWGQSIAASLPGSGTNVVAAQDGTSSMPFWYISTDSAAGHSNATPVLEFLFQNSQNVGMWSLDAAGDATFTLAAATVSSVPLPGALWLFGSGLLALVGIGRRRNASAEVSAA